VSAGKDQDGDEARSLPNGFGLYDGDDEGRGIVETDDPGNNARRNDDVRDGIEGGVDGERVRGQAGQPVVQLFETEPAAGYDPRSGLASIVSRRFKGNGTDLRLKS
jgi:hypothetical protein